MVHEFGSVLWPELAQQYVASCMKPDQAQMADAARLHDLLKHFSTAEDFETAAVKLLYES